MLLCSAYLPFEPIGYFIYEEFNIKKCTFCPHRSSDVYCMDLRTKRDSLLYNNNWLVFFRETVCVYCAVRIESLSKI